MTEISIDEMVNMEQLNCTKTLLLRQLKEIEKKIDLVKQSHTSTEDFRLVQNHGGEGWVVQMRYEAYWKTPAVRAGSYPQSRWQKIIEAGSREDALQALAKFADGAQALLEKANEYKAPKLL